ncbi:uncharacterized protein [Haliotis cracherodii]|uniref:uncharacterized protein n=1 Tax=Haliotis cracherodii TaxID=6455 RepID=UPI0039EBB55A
MIRRPQLYFPPSAQSAAPCTYTAHTIPKLPKTRAEVDIAAPWRETHDGERFLLFEDGEEDKMLVFATDDQLRVLQSASIVHGTFSACPHLWNQLYILHARKGSITYPLVYALMPDRRTTTYQRLFAQLKVHIQHLLNQPFNPETFQVDFEVPAIRALQIEFQGSDIKGCFFHFTQAIWRKTQELGLAVGYRDNPLVEQWIRRAAALPLLPLQQVQDAWIDSMSQSPDVPNADEFNDYILHAYEARFPLSLWNHHQTFGPSTNNNLEGFHSRLNASLNHRHPNLYRFIEIIKKIEKSEKTELSQLDLGAAPPARKRVYKEIDNRLSRLKDQLSHGVKTPLQFLDAVGKLLKMD